MESSFPTGLLNILHRKNKTINKIEYDVDDEFHLKELQEEPSSPMISCTGEVKNRKKCEKNLPLFFRRKVCPFSSASSSITSTASRRTKISLIKPVFYLSEDKKIPSNMQRKSTCKLRAMCKMNIKNTGVSQSEQGDGEESRRTGDKFNVSGDGSKLREKAGCVVSKMNRSAGCRQGNEDESRLTGNRFNVSGDGCKLRENSGCLISKMNRSVACRRGGVLANFDWKTRTEEDEDEDDECKKASACLSKMNRSVACRRGGVLANFDWKMMTEEDNDEAEDEECKKASACLRKMNRSTACRRGGALSNFDWRSLNKNEDEDEQGYDDVINYLFSSGPRKQQLVAVAPRKEINLWQRRTLPKPHPIQLTASLPILAIS